MFATKNKVTLLQEKSNRIFNVFTQTMQDLSSVNSEVSDEIEDRNAQIAILQQEQSTLVATKTSNEKMISKINSFLNE